MRFVVAFVTTKTIKFNYLMNNGLDFNMKKTRLTYHSPIPGKTV